MVLDQGRGDAVLVAEDNEVNQRVIDAMLRRLGYQPTIVNNGREAVEAISDGQFDLVLMDVQMPEMDGLEATRLLRRSRSSEQLQILAITANALSEDRLRCLQVGMDDYIAKPVTMEQLDLGLSRARTRLREAASFGQLVDDSVLDGLREAVGDDHVRVLLDTFAISARHTEADLRKATIDRDSSRVAAITQRLAGSSAVIGANPLAACCGRVTTQARVAFPAEQQLEELYAVLASTVAAVID